MSYKNQIEKYLKETIDVLKKIDVDELGKVIKIIELTVKSNKNIYVMGNGGSASTASHMQNDLGNTVGQISGNRVKIFCLSDNIPTITSIANDYSYDAIYIKQLHGRLEKDDLVIAISGSGKSQNIINAVEYAKSVKTNIVAMTGYDGGNLKKMADFNLNVPIENMQISEDIHLLFNHLITHILKSTNKNFSHDY